MIILSLIKDLVVRIRARALFSLSHISFIITSERAYFRIDEIIFLVRAIVMSIFRHPSLHFNPLHRWIMWLESRNNEAKSSSFRCPRAADLWLNNPGTNALEKILPDKENFSPSYVGNVQIN